MSNDDRKRQKKIEKKTAKRKALLAKRVDGAGKMLLHDSPIVAGICRYPLYECIAPVQLFDMGIGNLLVSRKLPDDQIAVSIFLVDLFCLGVKSSFFAIVPESEYHNTFKNPEKLGACKKTDPSWTRKLIEDAVSYARNLGFNPDPDYIKAKMIFGDIDPKECTEEFQFGKDGKPFYIQGPNESNSQAQQIIKQLEKICGHDGFHSTMSAF